MTEGLGQPVRRWREVFDVVSTLAMLALASVVVWLFWQSRMSVATRADEPSSLRVPIPSEPIEISDAFTLGSESAVAAIVEYADFECPACRQFAGETEPVLRRDYVETGQVRFLFRNYPLPSHQRAVELARTAWCAGRQNRFWQVHDLLFTPGTSLDRPTLEADAVRVGVDLQTYRKCRATAEASEHVQQEKIQGTALGVPATPSFLLGRVTSDRKLQVVETMVGARSIEAFRAILDRLLK